MLDKIKKQLDASTFNKFHQVHPTLLFKGTELKHFIPREHIEGRDIQDICMDIKDAFDEKLSSIILNNLNHPY